MPDTAERPLRKAPVALTIGLFAALLGAGSASPDEFGCCRFFKDGEAERECRTLFSQDECADHAAAVGKCFIYEERRTCFDGVCEKPVVLKVRLTCRNGFNEGAPCRSSADCVGVHSTCTPESVPTGRPVRSELMTPRDAIDKQTCTLDTTPPLCVRLSGSPPGQLEVKTQDLDLGLQQIEILIASNASVNVPLFSVGTKDPVIVTAFRVDPNSGARVELLVRDLAGNETVCDPILTQVIRGSGAPVSETYTGLHAAEDTVTIDNGRPGLRNLEIAVNGRKFRMTNLRDGQSQTIDVSSAMFPGSQNVISLKSYGKPGTSASVMIWDGNDTSER